MNGGVGGAGDDCTNVCEACDGRVVGRSDRSVARGRVWRVGGLDSRPMYCCPCRVFFSRGFFFEVPVRSSMGVT